MKFYIYSIMLSLSLASCLKLNAQITDEKPGTYGYYIFQKQQFFNSLPNQKASVSDFDYIFTAKEIQQLTTIIEKAKIENNIEIAVVTLDMDFKSYKAFENYTQHLGNKWDIGSLTNERGILIAINVKQRWIRIHNTYAVEDILTNDSTKKILDDFITPEYKKNNYFLGTKKGIIEILKYFEKR